MKPTIDVISLGGTITMKPEGLGLGAVPKLSAKDLVKAIPEISKIANIRAETFRSVPSGELSFDDIEALASKIIELKKSGSDGVLIVQGTDTLEETAYALDIFLDLDIPVIVTGAMRNPSIPGADGPANLLSSIVVAASPDCELRSVLVVFDDEIHLAKHVRKSHTSNTRTFQSLPLGPIGWVTEERAIFCLSSREKPAPLKLSPKPNAVWVPIIKLGMEDDGKLLSVAFASEASGIILEAFGGGHTPHKVAEITKAVSKSIPIILASRTGQGAILESTYGFPGSESDLLNGGLISAGRLDAIKSRMLLSMLLRHKDNNDCEISDTFEIHGQYSRP